MEGRGVGTALVDERQTGERLRDDVEEGRATDGVVGQGQVAAAVDGDGSGRGDLLESRGTHVHRRVADRQATRGRDRVPGVEARNRLAGLRQGVGTQVIHHQRHIRVDRDNLGAAREIGVEDRHPRGEARRIRKREGVGQCGDRTAALGGLTAGIQIERTAVDEGAARVGVVTELRGQLQRGATEAHERGCASDKRLQGRGVLIDIDEQFRARARNRIRTVDRVEGDCHARVGDEAHTERVSRAVDRGDRQSRAGREAQRIHRLGAGRHRAAAAVVKVAGSGRGIDRVQVTAEAGRVTPAVAQRDDAEGVRVGREGIAIRDGPAADEVVDQAARIEGHAADLGEE